MSKFKAGDIVVGNDRASVYSVTAKGVRCEVVMPDLGRDVPMMRVKLIIPGVWPGTFDVYPEAFDLVHSAHVPTKPTAGKFKLGEARTREGQRAVIYTIDGKGKQPIMGERVNVVGDWIATAWSTDGRYENGSTPGRLDLMPNVEPLKEQYEMTVGDSAQLSVPCDAFKGKKVKITVQEVTEE